MVLRQPILVGTVSVDKSEYLSRELTKAWVTHNVLNAKQHEKEAEIVGAAGQKWAVTIATNMAGRGTDIKLGEWVSKLWGLIILGTEKHETRRIDNQLRGRAGRQWDPGMTQFLISPNDDIMRIFWGDKLFWVFNSPMFASLPDNEPLTQSSMLTRKVTWVQKQVEWHHFDSRKHVLEYDDVINKHREIIYRRRNTLLSASWEDDTLEEMCKEMIHDRVKSFVLAQRAKAWSSYNHWELISEVHRFLGREIIDDILEKQDVSANDGDIVLADYFAQRAVAEFENIQKNAWNSEVFQELIKRIMLQSIDVLWMNHIDAMSKLREQVAFVWYAQKQPLMVYKEQAFKKFENLLREIELRVVKSLFAINDSTKVEIKRVDDSKLQVHSTDVENMNMSQKNSSAPQTTIKSSWNPLFNSPRQAQKQNATAKNKIRV